MGSYLAHRDEKTNREHPLQDHLNEVGALASKFASIFNAKEWGRLAGVAHDLGKATPTFQRRLHGVKEPVDHKTAGAKWLQEHLGPMRGRMLAYTALGHHGGMPNGYDASGSSLSTRLEHEVVPWDRGILNLLEIPKEQAALPIKQGKSRRQCEFQIAFFVRMLFSCLVDADFLDTEQFFDPLQTGHRGGYPELLELSSRLNAHLAEKTSSARSSPINSIRAEILDACRKAALLDPGFFSLTVPTGGGKTLASLAFALDHTRFHASQRRFRRVIYAIPYTSIIEQTATVFREVLGENAILEHHSNYDFREATGESKDDSVWSENRKARLASENWDAPVVVTTNVQFFESLFHNRPSRCRRLHNIAGSIVILDEAQMLPVDYLLPCLEALRELVLNYGVSVVLCTATQPALGVRDDFSSGLQGVREIIPDPVGLATRMQRVQVQRHGILDDQTLTKYLAGEQQCLCVVNTRRHAARLHALLQPEEGVFHLSANMCPAHRSAKLEEIRARLSQGHPCRVVSTQLVEAGVDIDFPVVYRAATGIDSIAQAAGRCNREGLLEKGVVHVFDVAKEDLPPGLLRQCADTARPILEKFEDPLSLDALDAYFRELYWRRGDLLDKHNILDKFSEGASQGNFSFREAAEQFRLIEDAGESLIIPWDEQSRDWIARLEHAEAPFVWVRKLQRYTISIPRSVFIKLQERGAILTHQDRYSVLSSIKSFYRDDVGLWTDAPVDPSSFII